MDGGGEDQEKDDNFGKSAEVEEFRQFLGGAITLYKIEVSKTDPTASSRIGVADQQ